MERMNLYLFVFMEQGDRGVPLLFSDLGIRHSEYLDHLNDPSVGVRISTQIAAYDAILQRQSAGKNWNQSPSNTAVINL